MGGGGGICLAVAARNSLRWMVASSDSAALRAASAFRLAWAVGVATVCVVGGGEVSVSRHRLDIRCVTHCWRHLGQRADD